MTRLPMPWTLLTFEIFYFTGKANKSRIDTSSAGAAPALLLFICGLIPGCILRQKCYNDYDKRNDIGVQGGA